MISIADIWAARPIVMQAALRTPLVRLPAEDAPAEIYLKLENLQAIGSFKLRGAYHALSTLPAEQLQRLAGRQRLGPADVAADAVAEHDVGPAAGLGGRVDAVVAISSPADTGSPLFPRARLLGTFAATERGRRLLDRYGTRVDPSREPLAASPLDLVGEIAPIPVASMQSRFTLRLLISAFRSCSCAVNVAPSSTRTCRVQKTSPICSSTQSTERSCLRPTS